MFAPVVAALASLAGMSVALPTALSYYTPASCEGLGGGAFGTASDFTLSAINTTLPNTNATGAPLVLGQAGAVDGAEFEVLSTYATYPYNDWPTFSLDEGVLTPISATGANTTAVNATAGNPPSFITTSLDPPAPVAVYCAIADTDPTEGSPYPILSVNGDANDFYLCMTGDGSYAQNNIVWQPTADNYGEYDYDSCYPVNILLLGLD